MEFRDRIKELRRVRAGDLIPHPKNWRTHPPAQRDALRGILAEIGYADALLAREIPEGLQTIDGHMRAEETPDQEVPVLVLDLTEEEAEKLLATLDPIAAMAEANQPALDALLADLGNSKAVEAAFGGPEDVEVALRQLTTEPPPPRMTWVLIGISTVRFGEIAHAVEAMAEIDDIVLETTANNG
jgi:hypothetical protein